MNIPNPKTWSAGLWSAAEMNVDMRDALGFFLSPPMCIARKERNSQSVDGFNSAEQVTWDTLVYDNDNAYSTDVLTCHTAGYYVVTWQLQFSSPTVSGSGNRSIDLRLYDASFALLDVQNLVYVRVQVADESYSGTLVLPLNVLDNFTLVVGHFNSGDTSIVGYDVSKNWYGCQMSMRWLSSL